jgi:tRNA A-37 threonylcarbamoyl transferase component Bud32/tetratricopeptide (TPR) repeat protein
MSQNPTPGNSSPLKELTGRIGKYDIVKPLGKGAMGIVYLAHDTVLERDVALKVMVAQIADDPELRGRFEREAKAVARMTHPNVVNVFDLGTHTDGSPFIAMELLKGQDLQKAMRGPAISIDRKLAIIVQVLAGLAHAHEAGIVHRDIKPANIFINADGTVKIMDFGVARLTTASMTGTGNIVGTADYMSPEQVKGARVDGRSDLFSVGCMLFELLAGQRPFHSDNLMAIFYKITHEEPNFTLIPDQSDYQDLMPILQKALAKALEERYQTAYDFASDLREYLKVHASSRSGQHALEDLARIEPPRGVAADAMTDAPGATVVQAGTGEMGGAATTLEPGATRVDRPATRSGTGTVKASAATVAGRTLGASSSPTVLAPSPGGRTTARPPAYPSPRRPEPEPASKTGLYAGIGVAALLVVGVGIWFFLQSQGGKKTADNPTPAPTKAATEVMTQAPTAATAEPTQAATAAPTVKIDAGSKAAASLKAAQAALGKGDYGKAVEQAQAALREEPSNASAQELLNRALAGQKAESHFRAAESAVRAGQYAEAQREVDSARALAPWDSRGPELLQRIDEGQRRDQQRAAQQAEIAKRKEQEALVSGYVSKAALATADGKYDEAISLYREALKIDGQNQTALNGLTTVAGLKAAAANPSSGGPGPAASGKRFYNGKTVATSAETKSAGAGPEGFEDSSGLGVKRASAATDLPGKILFEVTPEVVKSGDKYVVRITFSNEGNSPISIKSLMVTYIVNGRRAGAPLSPMVSEVAPRQKATLLEMPEIWKEDTTSWQMEAKITTARGETYTNQVTWR